MSPVCKTILCKLLLISCRRRELPEAALAVVAAESLEEALSKLAEQNAGWRIEDLRALTPRVYDLDVPQVIFTDVRGSIAE